MAVKDGARQYLSGGDSKMCPSFLLKLLPVTNRGPVAVLAYVERQVVQHQLRKTFFFWSRSTNRYNR